MATKPSVFRNFLNSFRALRRKDKLIGEDHLGNQYYEKNPDPERNLRGSRWVQPLNSDRVEPPTVPVEWDAWLQYKRPHPPTQEEIDRNYAMMMRTLHRAKELEKIEKERLESAEQEALKGPENVGTSLEKAQEKTKTGEFPVYPDLNVKPPWEKDTS